LELYSNSTISPVQGIFDWLKAIVGIGDTGIGSAVATLLIHPDDTDSTEEMEIEAPTEALGIGIVREPVEILTL